MRRPSVSLLRLCTVRDVLCLGAALGPLACIQLTRPEGASSSAPSSSSGTTSTSSGASSGSGSSSSGGLPDLHARCLAEAGAECAHDAQCGWIDPSGVALCLSASECVDLAAEAAGDAELDAGKYGLDLASYRACLADVAAAPCSLTGAQAYDGSSNCARIDEGTSPPGGPCEFHGDCAVADSTCLRYVDACGGTCASPLISGPCGTGHAGLAVGYFCGGDGGVREAQPDGGPCAGLDSECQPGLLCGGTNAYRFCQPQGDAQTGEACSTFADCALDGTCQDIDVGSPPTGFCFMRSGVGDSCASLYGDGGEVPVPDGGTGRYSTARCHSNEYCDPATRLCEAEATLGERCNLDGGDPSCLVAACRAGADGGGLCQLVPDGEPCGRDLDCLSQSCQLSDAGALVCAHSCP